MHNIAVFFDNKLEKAPFVLSSVNGRIRLSRRLSEISKCNNLICLGLQDVVGYMQRVNIELPVDVKRIELLYLLKIGFSKGDRRELWDRQKARILGRYLKNPAVLADISRYDKGEIAWDGISKTIIGSKKEIIEAATKAYVNCLRAYRKSKSDRKKWLTTEFAIDNIFLKNQYNGIRVDNNKIEATLQDLNFQRYESLLFLDKNNFSDGVGDSNNQEKLTAELLKGLPSEERCLEIAELIDGLPNGNAILEAISNIKASAIEYSNLIKHYSSESAKIHPIYSTIGSSSGRIFVENPGIQYLKKIHRNILLPSHNKALAYFDFRNYEPGIAAGISGDPDFVRIYNAGDLYSGISVSAYSNIDLRKYVKFTILAYLYGMSKNSLLNHFKQIKTEFSPIPAIETMESFSTFHSWRDATINKAMREKKVEDECYTRRYSAQGVVKVKNSAVNHLIQSIGSRILKSSIVEVSQLPKVNVLIPLHDAILCELPEESYQAISQQIIEIMESQYSLLVPGVFSKVVLSNFSE